MKISGVYKITNTVTGDFYIGSSKDVKRRWREHKYPSRWKNYPNNPMYIDMKNYGIDKFEFQVIAEVEIDSLKVIEQQFIEMLNPTYNNRNANGFDFERQKEYNKSNKRKESQKKYQKSDKCKESQKKYKKSKKYKETHRKAVKEYESQPCRYNGETLTLKALRMRFKRQGIPHPTIEAKKYIIKR